MVNSVLRQRTIFQARSLFVLTTSVGALYIIVYQLYLTNGPRQVFKESLIIMSQKVSHTKLSSSNMTLSAVLSNIFKIKRTIKAIKQVSLFNKTLHTTNKDTGIVSNHSKEKPTKSKYLLTLFSTWTSDKERYNISSNTIKNWASFKPTFNIVLFTNDTDLSNDAHLNGWTVLPLLKEAKNGLPILKYMFIDVITEFRSTFYCYANSDILFEDGLVKTLANLENKLGSDFLMSKPVILTGFRWNVLNVLPNEISPRENIKTLIQMRGKVFRKDAEDYFITNGIPEVVVGALAYDNWLVANAREKKHLTIDTSRTIPALHQSVDNNNCRSHTRETANYNRIVLNHVYKTNILYQKGVIICIEKFTDFVNDSFVIGDRLVSMNCT